MQNKTEFFDHQVNGFAGVDFQKQALTGEEMLLAVSALRKHRTTKILFTLITDTVSALEKKLRQIEQIRAQSPEITACIAGYHLEGPYLWPEPGYHGAHPPKCMKAPDVDEFMRLQEAGGGRIRLVTLAPEWPGSISFIKALHREGVRVGIGHSQADDETIERAIEAGLSFCTHLGNAVPHELPRHDNIIQRLLAHDTLTAAFIPDGIHLSPTVLQNFVRAKPRGKVLFTTDCMAAAAAPPGQYRLGRLLIDCGADGVVREPGKPNCAGSSLTMDQACRNVQNWLGWNACDAENACGRDAAAFFGIRF